MRDTLGSVAFKAAGFREGRRALAYLVAWGVASDRAGRPLTVEEYGEWWKSSRATAYRERAAFAKAFPDEVDPARLWATVKAQVPFIESSSDRPEVAELVVSAVAVPWAT